jgi:hypothetical protein
MALAALIEMYLHGQLELLAHVCRVRLCEIGVLKRRPIMHSSFNESGMTEYRSTWLKGVHPEWLAFRKDWWGPNARKKADLDSALNMDNGHIVIEQDYVRVLFNMVQGGWMLVRDEYKDLYNRLCVAEGDSRVNGVVVTGQPGIGRSLSC